MIIAIDTNANICLRGYSQTTDFGVQIVPASTVVSGSVTDQTIVKDVVFNTLTSSVINNVCRVIVRQPINQTSPCIISVSPSNLATVDGTGLITMLEPGQITITVTGPSGTKTFYYNISQSGGQEASVFSNFVAGSLAAACVNTINSEISGKSPGAGTQTIIASTGNASPIRNESLFVGMDTTGLAYWLGGSSGGPGGGGTLITPQDIAFATHLPISVGTVVYFADASNNIYSTTVTSVVVDIGGSDIAIGHLYSPMPSAIKPAKILPSNWQSYMPSLGYGVPILSSNRFKTLCIQDTTSWQNQPIIGQVINFGQASGALANWFAENSSTTVAVTDGDSGSPVFLYAGGDTIFLGHLWFASACPSYADYATQINAALVAAGSSYTLTIANLSSYTSF